MLLMVSCCEVAIVLAITNIVSLAVFAGYTVHLRLKQLILEKKNGAEQHQINQLKKQFRRLQKQLNERSPLAFKKDNDLPALPEKKDPR